MTTLFPVLATRQATVPSRNALRPGACALALALACTTWAAGAAEVQVGMSATAIDIGLNSVSNSSSGMAGPVQGTPPRLVLSTSAAAGVVSSGAFVGADALTGQMRAGFNSLTNIDENPRPGRGGSARGSGLMTGAITLVGAAPPGVASFSAVIEGAYNFGNSVFRFNNSAHIDFSGSIGDVTRNALMDFDLFSSAGLFSIPITWTMPVQPGQRLDMSFYLSGRVASVVSGVTLDLSNTFKLTAITLPAGYSYVSDAQGFLSQFQSPVPEPTGSVLLLAGGLALAWRRRCTAGRLASAGKCQTEDSAASVAR